MHEADSYRIDDEAQIFLVAPYWTSTASVGMAPANRKKLLTQLRCELNRGLPDAPEPDPGQAGQQDDTPEEDLSRWKLEPFNSPRTLKLRRHGQLSRHFELHEELLTRLREVLGEGVLTDYAARVTYFDYGIGCIEVTLGCRFGRIGVETFSTNAEKAKLVMVEAFNNGLTEADLDLEDLDKRISGFLVDAMKGIPNKLRPTYDDDVVDRRAQMFCGPVSRNIVFIDSNGLVPQLTVSAKQLSRAAYTFLNEANDDDGRTGSDKIPISHEGFEGAVALIRRSQDASERVEAEMSWQTCLARRIETEEGEVRRTKLLWSLIHIYWSALFCASEGFFGMAASYGQQDLTRRQIEDELAEIEKFQSIVSMIKFESQPEKVIVEGEDRSRYANVWHAYESEELLSSLDQIRQDSTATVQSLRDRSQKIYQSRIALTVNIFTLLMALSTVVDLVVFFHMERPTAIGVILVTTFVLIVAISILLFHRDLLEWAQERWKSSGITGPRVGAFGQEELPGEGDRKHSS